MLDATYGGWKRYTLARAACRNAAEELHAIRKERITKEWMVKWTFGTKLAGGLARGLKNLFVRSTFGVFKAWATYAAEEAADRHASDLLAEKIEMANKEDWDAFALLDYSGRRWRMYEVGACFDIWSDFAEFAATATVFTHLAVSHSTQACMMWAFKEYSFAVKVQIEERAAALFYDNGRLAYAVRIWAYLAKKRTIQSSRAARAIFHFFGRLTSLIFFKWHEWSKVLKGHAPGARRGVLTL